MTPDPEAAVRERYSAAAHARENALCCPVTYNPKYLAAIPAEVLERDYGCGDPSAHLQSGERVLDLGSGGGKICFIASQVVGASGSVLGVDMNPEMLALARGAAPAVAERVGFDNVTFSEGRIQDLRFDPAASAEWLRAHPVTDAQGALAYAAFVEQQRAERPLVTDESVDVVVSNCVLNLVRNEDKQELFREIWRVTARGGRAVISDIVADETVPAELQADPELWSGCISGALREDEFLQAFADAGFYGVRMVARDAEPWQTVRGIEFRSVTVEAFRGKEGPCLEGRQAVIYKGPFKAVLDDDGHTLRRGERTAVCKKTFALYGRAPYRDAFELVEPRVAVAEGTEEPFACQGGQIRDPRETKGFDYDVTTDVCGPSCC